MLTEDFDNGSYDEEFSVTGTVGEEITITKTLQNTDANISYTIDKITKTNSAVQ